MFRRRGRLKLVSLAVLAISALAGCGSTGDATPNRRVDEAAIAQELNREVPGLEHNPAFRAQVSDIADLCRSSTTDFKINATTVGTPTLQRQFRRQISAGCPWRLAELDQLFAHQDNDG